MKLRYLVPVTPLVVLLGVRVLSAAPERAERRLAWVIGLGWLALLALTLGDLTGTEDNPRPERWKLMAGAGAVFLALPLLLRHSRLAGPGLRLGLCSGVLAAPVLAALALLAWPHTAYHSTPLTPDVYGQQKEAQEERAAATTALAHEALLAYEREWAASPEVLALPPPVAVLGVAGPPELLEYPIRRMENLRRTLLTLPYAAGPEFGDEALAALIDRGYVHAVFAFSGQGLPEALHPGDTWLSGRLRVLQTWVPVEGGPRIAGAMLCVVER
jgi:hypothetical protein